MTETNQDPEQNGSLFDSENLFMTRELYQRFCQLKEDQEEAVKDVEESITSVQQELMNLRNDLEEFHPEQKKLMTVLIARSIKRALREILIQKTDLPEQS